MLPIERQRKILDLVNENGSVLVKDLALMFSVSKDSIRNDLTYLEENNLLEKSYGGAVRVRKNPHEIYASERIDKNIKEKQIISQKAFEMLEDGLKIYLDMSTTNILLAEKIANSDLKLFIVTNMREIVRILENSDNVDLIVLGGRLNATKEGFTGWFTNMQLEMFEFDIAFMGVVGVSLEDNKIYTYEMEDGITKSKAIENSHKSFLMLDTRKLYYFGNFAYEIGRASCRERV